MNTLKLIKLALFAGSIVCLGLAVCCFFASVAIPWLWWDMSYGDDTYYIYLSPLGFCYDLGQGEDEDKCYVKSDVCGEDSELATDDNWMCDDMKSGVIATALLCVGGCAGVAAGFFGFVDFFVKKRFIRIVAYACGIFMLLMGVVGTAVEKSAANDFKDNWEEWMPFIELDDSAGFKLAVVGIVFCIPAAACFVCMVLFRAKFGKASG